MPDAPHNPPAFPNEALYSSGPDGIVKTVDRSEGMTLRDYFAASALPACVARVPLATTKDVEELFPSADRRTPQQGALIRKAIAELAYKYADAMLRARDK